MSAMPSLAHRGAARAQHHTDQIIPPLPHPPPSAGIGRHRLQRLAQPRRRFRPTRTSRSTARERRRAGPRGRPQLRLRFLARARPGRLVDLGLRAGGEQRDRDIFRSNAEERPVSPVVLDAEIVDEPLDAPASSCRSSPPASAMARAFAVPAGRASPSTHLPAGDVEPTGYLLRSRPMRSPRSSSTTPSLPTPGSRHAHDIVVPSRRRHRAKSPPHAVRRSAAPSPPATCTCLRLPHPCDRQLPRSTPPASAAGRRPGAARGRTCRSCFGAVGGREVRPERACARRACWRSAGRSACTPNLRPVCPARSAPRRIKPRLRCRAWTWWWCAYARIRRDLLLATRPARPMPPADLCRHRRPRSSALCGSRSRVGGAGAARAPGAFGRQGQRAGDPSRAVAARRGDARGARTNSPDVELG